MLKAELRRAGMDKKLALRLRAGEWFAERGDMDRAVHHLIAAGEFERAGEIVWASSADFVASGREGTIRSWLEEFTDAQILASPALCLAQATVYLSDGDGARVERWTGAALDRLRDSGAERPDAHELMITATLVRAAASANDGVVQMERDVAGIFDLLPGDSPWLSLCRLLEGTSFLLTGDDERARKALEEGVRRGGATAPSLQVICMAQLADPRVRRGRSGWRPHVWSTRLSVQSEHYGIGEFPTHAVLYAAAALVRASDGRSDEAAQDLKTAGRLLDRTNEISPWFDAEVRILLARALLLLDDVAGGRARLAEGGRSLARTADASLLSDWIAAGWKDAEAASSVTGRWQLSPAELRLLHYLPTHLTFREIAAEVFVSANTVKTQARAIYRKLGVSSRAEAVTCARSAGLLEADEAAGGRASIHHV